MNKQKRMISKKLKAVNLLGSTGYFFVILQWLFAFVLYFGWINTHYFQVMMPPVPQDQPIPSVTPPAADDTLPLIAIVGIALFVIIMLAVTVYAFLRIPKMVAGAGNKMATIAVNQAAPLVIKAKRLPDSKKNQMKIRGVVLIYVKVAMIAVPLLLSWTVQYMPEQILPSEIALLAGAVIAVPAILFFGLQYFFGRIAKLKTVDLI